MGRLMTVTPEFYDRMFQGDDRCPIKIGQRVVKILEEKNDIHPIGTKGTVRGNVYHDELGAAYLVKFDSTPTVVFVVGAKIELDVHRETRTDNTSTI